MWCEKGIRIALDDWGDLKSRPIPRSKGGGIGNSQKARCVVSIVLGSISILINDPSSLCWFLSRLSKATAGLDSLNLGLGERLATEAGGELVAVKVEALGGLDGAKSGAGRATNAGLLTADGLAKGAVLLGVLAVGAEGGGRTPVGGERVGGRGRVRLGSVVDGSCWTKSKMSARHPKTPRLPIEMADAAQPECSEAQHGEEEHTRNGSATEELDGRNTLSVSSSAENPGGGEHGCGFAGWVC